MWNAYTCSDLLFSFIRSRHQREQRNCTKHITAAYKTVARVKLTTPCHRIFARLKQWLKRTERPFAQCHVQVAFASGAGVFAKFTSQKAQKLCFRPQMVLMTLIWELKTEMLTLVRFEEGGISNKTSFDHWASVNCLRWSLIKGFRCEGEVWTVLDMSVKIGRIWQDVGICGLGRWWVWFKFLIMKQLYWQSTIVKQQSN